MAQEPDPKEPNQDAPLSDIEAEVNSLIAEAEALTSDLASEVGAEADPPASARDAEFFASETDSESSLDVQVEQADAVLDKASAELGATAPPAPPARPRKAIVLPAKGGAESGAATPAAAPPIVPKTPGRRQVVLPSAAGAGTPASGGATGVNDLVAARVVIPPFPEKVKREAAARAIMQSPVVERLQVGATRCMDAICSALVLADRPFHQVGDRARTVLGWCALLIAVAAVSLFFFAVL